MADQEEDAMPQEWGESYRGMKQPINPPGRPKACDMPMDSSEHEMADSDDMKPAPNKGRK
jgi:hypothetical protein